MVKKLFVERLVPFGDLPRHLVLDMLFWLQNDFLHLYHRYKPQIRRGLIN